MTRCWGPGSQEVTSQMVQIDISLRTVRDIMKQPMTEVVHAFEHCLSRFTMCT